MTTFVEIAVNVPQVGSTFHYHLPPELDGCIQPGHLVEVPFGTQLVQGVVLRQVKQPDVPDTKQVISLIDEQAVLTPLQIRLAFDLAESTLSPLSDCIELMIPPGLAQQADTLYQKAEDYPPPFRPLSNIQSRLLKLISQRGPLRGRQLDNAFPHLDWRPSARSLVKQGLLSTKTVLPPPSVHPKTVRTASLLCSTDKAEEHMPRLARAGSPALERRQAILRVLMREHSEQGEMDVTWLYAESGGNLADLQALAERGLVSLGEAEIWRDPLDGMDVVLSEPPVLTPAQQNAWEEIAMGIQSATGGKSVQPYLLHGVTGSGKTEIYLQAVQATLKLGRQAIMLVPEIALTAQTIRRFVSRFPSQVGSMHSRLSTGERFDTWRRARLGQISVMIGPRSALFAPFARPGLIIVDEFHDDSYYQSETQPHYHAREAAIAYARMAGAVCILGSATPDIVSRYQAARKRWHYIRLPERILAHRLAVEAQVQKLGIRSRYQLIGEQTETIDLPRVEVVDMREELKAGNRSIFSRALQLELHEIIENDQQAILFLNRRGSATYIFCRDCGYILKCPRCDLPLTHHVGDKRKGYSNDGSLTCHYCAYERKMPSTCPACGSERIRHYGTGTEKVETELQKLLPQAQTLRWDFETTRMKGAHDAILSHFINHHANVLIGTQMIAKGLDLPLVTLVGVVLADVGLSLPDIRAAERTFQVLTQVAGRAGRSPLGGQVILQTFQPEHYVIQAAAHHDYQNFYRQELEYRRQLHYPPFSQLVRLEYRHHDPEHAEKAALTMATQIKNWLREEKEQEIELVGPVPCFFSRLGGLYRWQIVLRGPDPASFLRDRSLGEWRVEVNPPSLL